MLENGDSIRKIGCKLGVGKSTVGEIRSQLQSSVKENLEGRPSKLTANDRRYLTRLISTGRADTASQLQRLLFANSNTSISTQTIRNALRKEDMVARVKVKKPFLSAKHRKACLGFAQKYEHWTEKDWERVMFTDETKVNCIGSDGRQWVWKKAGSPMTSQHVQKTVKFGGGSVMVWGCMTAKGVGYMCKIDGKMDAALYEEILEDHVFQSLEYYGLDSDDFIFQQDNDPKHKSKRALKWFEDHGLSY